ncbi:hypothetical protein MWE_0088 [Helicobacter pylori XZ274]|nr:hypothetical protein MWE_0088 [Helicobacter pylori XZ274]
MIGLSSLNASLSFKDSLHKISTNGWPIGSLKLCKGVTMNFSFIVVLVVLRVALSSHQLSL